MAIPRIMNKYKNVLLSVASGLLAAFAFPKAGLFFLAWVALVPLLFALSESKLKQSFFYGLLAGFVFNAIGLYWLVPMLKFQTGSLFQALLASGLLWVYLALYWGVWALLIGLVKKYTPQKYQISSFVIFAPVIWVVLEYIRTYFLTGFPWMLIGYSQYRFTEIIQISEFTGIYGVSFLIILCNVFFYLWVSAVKNKKYLYAALGVILVFAVFGAFRMDAFKFYGREIKQAAIVQTNIDQNIKWSSEHKNDIIAQLKKMSGVVAASAAKIDLTVWPESVIPGFIPYDKESFQTAVAISRFGGLNVIGAPHNAENGAQYNAVFAFEASSPAWIAVHNKNHLVPFGEFIPFRNELSKFFGVLNTLGDFTRGTDTVVFGSGKIFAGSTICSENFFPDISRRFVLSGAQVLTNSTNDAWFFGSSAQPQHFIMNIFRAVETRKYMLVSANTGVSGVVEASGRIITTSKIGEEKIITAEFLQNDYKSFYVQHGDWFIYICIALLLVFAVYASVFNYTKRKK